MAESPARETSFDGIVDAPTINKASSIIAVVVSTEGITVVVEPVKDVAGFAIDDSSIEFTVTWPTAIDAAS